MRESVFETIVGAAVVAVAALFLWFAFDQGGEPGSRSGQYDVTARFNSVSGLNRGADVRIAGVRAGVVKAIDGDPERFEAVVRIGLDQKWELPDDSDARIVTDGLLGSAFVSIEPGGGFDMIPRDGSGEILFTRGSVDLLTLFASFAAGGGSGSGSNARESDNPPAEDPFGEPE